MTIFYGEQETGKLLILTQVILSLQLPFAVVPLVQFTADRAKMGALTSPKWLIAFAGADRGGHHRPQHQADLGPGGGLNRGGQTPHRRQRFGLAPKCSAASGTAPILCRQACAADGGPFAL